MKLKMDRYETVTVKDLAEASKIYCKRRDKSGEGASTFDTATVVDDDDNEIGYVSYNGRIWAEKWTPESVPIYDNQIK